MSALRRFLYSTPELLLKHISRVHANEPNCCLRCIFGACEIAFKIFHSYQRHVRKKHRTELMRMRDNDEPEIYENYEENYNDNEDSLDTQDDTDASALETPTHDETGPSTECISQREAALWILKLKEGRKLTQSATEEILSDVTELCSSVIYQLKDKLCQVLESTDITPSNIPGFNDLFTENSPYLNPFHNLKSQYMQLTYFHNHLNFVVSIQIYKLMCWLCMFNNLGTSSSYFGYTLHMDW